MFFFKGWKTGWEHIVKQAQQLSDVVQVTFRGKRLAVIGPRATGKTRLLLFLTQRELLPLTASYYQTLDPQRTNRTVHTIGESSIALKRTLDVSGGENTRDADWRGLIKSSHAVLYLMRADWLLNLKSDNYTTHINRIVDDFGIIQGWLKEDRIKPPFLIVVTHCDRVEGYGDCLGQNYQGDFQDKIYNLKCLETPKNLISAHVSTLKLVAGSLAKQTDAVNLEKQILGELGWR